MLYRICLKRSSILTGLNGLKRFYVIITGVCIILLLWHHLLFPTMKQIILVKLSSLIQWTGQVWIIYTCTVMREKLLVIVILTSPSSFIINTNALKRIWNGTMLCLQIALML